MSQDADYLIFQPSTAALNAPQRTQLDTAPLSAGVWQQETVEVLQMYRDKAQFSAVQPS
jgi:hypothetical protein